MKCTCEFLPVMLADEEGEERPRGRNNSVQQSNHHIQQEWKLQSKSRKRKASSSSSHHLKSWNSRRTIPSTNMNLLGAMTIIACVHLLTVVGGVGGVPTTDSIAISSDNSNSRGRSLSRSIRNSDDSLLQLIGGASRRSECAGVIRNLKVVASQTVIVGGAAGRSNNNGWGDTVVSNQARPNTTQQPRYQNLCSGDRDHSNASSSTSSSCCPSTLIPHLLHSPESNLLLTTFNNSFKYTTFKTQITAHLKLIQSYESLMSSANSKQLWNATIDGLKVLREWGVKYWDPLYLYKNRVFSEECLRRIGQNSFCYACGGGLEVHSVKPCKSLCHNTVTGCLKSPLAEYIESPWKHAVNSVRTAVRLVMTTGGDGGSNSYGVVGGKQDNNRQPLQDLVNDLNDWREPITWWLDEYKSSRACEGLPSTDCWNGESVGRYESSPVVWRSSYNPEFSGSSTNGGGVGGSRGGNWLDPLVTVELDKFRNELVYVRRTLEKFWPTTSPPSQIRTPHALPLSSIEDHHRGHPPASPNSHLHSLVHYEGSGGGAEGFESDDEDLEYNNSGYGPHIETDDEDLAMGEYYGSGSGDGATFDNTEDGGMVTDPDDGIGVINSNEGSNKKDRPPVSLSGGRGVKAGSTNSLHLISISLTLLLLFSSSMCSGRTVSLFPSSS